MDVESEYHGGVGRYAEIVSSQKIDQSMVVIDPDFEDFIFMKKDGRYYLVHYSGNASYVELPKQFRDSGNVVASYGVRGYAFAHMEYVSHVSLGDGVSFLEDYALCDSHVTHLHIGDDLASIGNMAFFGMSELTSFSISNNNDCFSTDGNGILFNKDKTTLIHFPRKLGLTSYTVPDSVRTIMDYAILGESLSSLTRKESSISV